MQVSLPSVTLVSSDLSSPSCYDATYLEVASAIEAGEELSSSTVYIDDSGMMNIYGADISNWDDATIEISLRALLSQKTVSDLRYDAVPDLTVRVRFTNSCTTAASFASISSFSAGNIMEMPNEKNSDGIYSYTWDIEEGFEYSGCPDTSDVPKYLRVETITEDNVQSEIWAYDDVTSLSVTLLDDVFTVGATHRIQFRMQIVDSLTSDEPRVYAQSDEYTLLVRGVCATIESMTITQLGTLFYGKRNDALGACFYHDEFEYVTYPEGCEFDLSNLEYYNEDESSYASEFETWILEDGRTMTTFIDESSQSAVLDNLEVSVLLTYTTFYEEDTQYVSVPFTVTKQLFGQSHTLMSNDASYSNIVECSQDEICPLATAPSVAIIQPPGMHVTAGSTAEVTVQTHSMAHFFSDVNSCAPEYELTLPSVDMVLAGIFYEVTDENTILFTQADCYDGYETDELLYISMWYPEYPQMGEIIQEQQYMYMFYEEYYYETLVVSNK
jgi:hypothetical protein